MTRTRSAFTTRMLLACIAVYLISASAAADQIADSIAQLSSQNPYDRRAAMESLGGSKNARAVQPLMDRLGNSTDGKWASKALAAIGTPSLDPLLKALSAKSPAVRGNAARALGIIGSEKAVKPLLSLQADKEPEVRAQAVEALGFSKDPSVTAAMLKIYNDPEQEHEVQQAACNAIVRIGDPKAIDVLLARLEDGGEIDHVVMALIHVTDVKVVRALVLTVSAGASFRTTSELWRDAGEAIVPSFLALLEDPDAKVRAGAAWGLSGVFRRAKHAGALQPLIAALVDTDPEVRMGAITALAAVGGESVVDALIRTLNDPDAKVRYTAVFEMRRLKNPRTVEPLCAMLSDPSAQVRQSALNTLDWLGDPRCVDAVLETTKNPDPEFGWFAYYVLGSTKDPRVLQPLLTALKDSNPSIQSAAAVGLGRFGSKDAVEPLITALKDERNIVQQSAISALLEIGDLRAVPPLIELLKIQDKETRSDVVRALGYLKDPRAVQPLLELMRTEPGDDSCPVCALGEIGDPSAVEPILAMLNDSSLDKEIRGNMLGTLGQYKDPRATPVLLAALNEDEEQFGNTVIEALIEIRDPRAFDALAEIVRNAKSFNRWNAAYALSLLDDPRLDEFLMPYAKKGDMAVIAGADQFFIKRGVEKAILPLLDALNSGEAGPSLSEAFIASGRAELVQAGKEWKAKHPGEIPDDEGATYAKWGEARMETPKGTEP